jgi:hypothetical protein
MAITLYRILQDVTTLPTIPQSKSSCSYMGMMTHLPVRDLMVE